MARILWHGIGPWHKTGYGKMTALFAPRIRDLGHEVVLGIMGQRGDKHPLKHPDARRVALTGKWEGMRVVGPGLTEFGLPPPAAILDAFGGHMPDLCIILKDCWVLEPDAYKRFPAVINWLAFDTDPMGIPDRIYFENVPHAVPAALSRWGAKAARDVGLDAVYVPHGIDTSLWTTGSKEDARRLLGLPQGVFIAGIDAQNAGPRKGWGEQFEAFAMHPDPGALLLVHAAPDNEEGMNLRHLAQRLGLNQSGSEPLPGDRVKFGSQFNMTELQMVNWYRSLDVLLACSYGEGFGVPIVQALACGKPVIGTRCTAITEKIPAGMGWTVPGHRWWHPHHQSWWCIPQTREIAKALGKAAAGKHAVPEVIRQWAVSEYDADDVTARYWKPLIEEVLHAGP